jgi:hypothetical protein
MKQAPEWMAAGNTKPAPATPDPGIAPSAKLLPPSKRGEPLAKPHPKWVLVEIQNRKMIGQHQEQADLRDVGNQIHFPVDKFFLRTSFA